MVDTFKIFMGGIAWNKRNDSREKFVSQLINIRIPHQGKLSKIKRIHLNTIGKGFVFLEFATSIDTEIFLEYFHQHPMRWAGKSLNVEPAHAGKYADVATPGKYERQSVSAYMETSTFTPPYAPYAISGRDSTPTYMTPSTAALPFMAMPSQEEDSTMKAKRAELADLKAQLQANVQMNPAAGSLYVPWPTGHNGASTPASDSIDSEVYAQTDKDTYADDSQLDEDESEFIMDSIMNANADDAIVKDVSDNYADADVAISEAACANYAAQAMADDTPYSISSTFGNEATEDQTADTEHLYSAKGGGVYTEDKATDTEDLSWSLPPLVSLFVQQQATARDLTKARATMRHMQHRHQAVLALLSQALSLMAQPEGAEF